MEERLTKDEKKALRKLEWEEKAKKDNRSAVIKKYSIWIGAAAIMILAIVGMYWLVTSPTQTQTTIKVAPVSKRDITNGDPKAKVTLIEYSDFQCPACAAYHPIVNQILKDYGKNLYFVYRMFPLTNAHPNSHIAAQAAYAALKQGKFFDMADLLFSKQQDWANLQDPTVAFKDYAKSLKLNTDNFTTEMNSDEAKNYVNASEQEALTEGLQATPTFIINGNEITNPQSLDDFKKLIDNELNKK
jgi:protein-disulfide isomerase